MSCWLDNSGNWNCPIDKLIVWVLRVFCALIHRVHLIFAFECSDNLPTKQTKKKKRKKCRYLKNVHNRNVPQLASSELSWQSLSPSQMYAGFVQIPVPHWNWPGLHLNSAVGRNMNKCALITRVWLWRCLSYNPHNHSRQAAGSSDRSPQSSSVSHFHQNGIHLSFLHTNWGEMLEVHISNEKWYVLFCLRLGLTNLMIMPSPGWRCS